MKNRRVNRSNFMKKTATLKIFFLLILSLMLASCISDPGAMKKKSKVKDNSIYNDKIGCTPNKLALILTESYECYTTCPEKTHASTLAETVEFLKENPSETVKEVVDNSKGICISDINDGKRPVGGVSIKNNYCSCLSGKADILNDCEAFCTTQPNNTTPTLTFTAELGADIANHPNLGSLYNWCTAQLNEDVNVQPQCFLSAWDGVSTIENIPVILSKNSNTMTANIQSLGYNKTYLMKLFVGNTGAENAYSTEFQVRRIKPPSSSTSIEGALKITPVSQYSCLSFGGKIVENIIYRNGQSYARAFFYFAANDIPAPIPPAGGTNQSLVLCHDEGLHPGNDSALYPRLELIPQHFALWDRSDPRFVLNGTKPEINSIIEQKLLNEYESTISGLDLFKPIVVQNRPNVATNTGSSTSTSVNMGYMMTPFINATTGKPYCPTSIHFNDPTYPLFNAMKEYMPPETEGIYLGEKEPETILDGSTYKTIYGTMFVTESILLKYGWYIENGLKIKADNNTMNTKTIYYFWPTNDSMDALEQGSRKLFTVRFYDALNGNVPSGISSSVRPMDKRLGCIPKS